MDRAPVKAWYAYVSVIGSLEIKLCHYLLPQNFDGQWTKLLTVNAGKNNLEYCSSPLWAWADITFPWDWLECYGSWR
jgi:hypothetical protein